MQRIWSVVAGVGLVLAGTSTLWESRSQAQTPATGQPGVRAPLPESIPVPKKHVLILAVANGFHHASITNAAATIWQMGHQSGVFDSEIRTDIKWITKGNPGGGESRNLDWRIFRAARSTC
jgi:hypothetical protein